MQILRDQWNFISQEEKYALQLLSASNRSRLFIYATSDDIAWNALINCFKYCLIDVQMLKQLDVCEALSYGRASRQHGGWLNAIPSTFTAINIEPSNAQAFSSENVAISREPFPFLAINPLIPKN